ncbi:MAG TPA: hypothetical protein VJ697_15035, partial [Nitrososphaeraceae archaeon]|nr:hypothetical protein [Nitrososphaeraceae archaeon]
MFDSLVYNRPIVFFVLLIVIIYIDISIVGIAIQYDLFYVSYNFELTFLIIMLISITSIGLILIHVNRLIKENKNILGKDLVISNKLIIIAQSIILILLTA